MIYRNVILKIILFSLIFISCHTLLKNDTDYLFQLLPQTQIGIDFQNNVAANDEMNIFNYHNFYNGGGVAIGDVNNDGRPDIFFTSNQGENKLYINKGNWKFEDATAKAGIASTHKWHTGVSMVDVNGDGWLDIYVCNAGIMKGDDRANELYINQKNGTFKEEAHAFGLDDKGCSTQAIFFDYDHDGDLDCFVLNNSPKSIDNFGYSSSIRYQRDSINGDRLYRNDGGHFTDVSAQAGLYGSEIAFGLGVTVGDVNNDGWDDIYVSNDFFEKDYLYINQHNGTFKEVSDEAIGHMSNGSMGSDMADINNDGYLDVFTTEMLPESDTALKTTIRFDDYDVQTAKNAIDLHHQFTSNCLQLNNHDGTFSEIAQLAGVDATGWSWGALSFDFDNDGWKDLFVCNGIYKDITDQDFLDFVNGGEAKNLMMNGQLDKNGFFNKIPSISLPNYAFVNQRNLLFKNESAQLGFTSRSFSNGAAYGDLDGDGDLDLVINNVNEPCMIYRNMSSETLHHHFLKIKLKGIEPNNFGFGARVTIYSNNNKQLLEEQPSRGFQSSVDPELCFGLDTVKKIDSVVVQWVNQKQQTLKNVTADTTIILNEIDAKQNIYYPGEASNPLFINVTASSFKGNISHHENEFVDFDLEKLIPKMLSTQGPKMAVGDVNGDGLEDFYIGSATADTAKIFIQQKDGRFIQKQQQAFINDKYFENIGATFFDVDKDGDLDLLVASGGNQTPQGSPYLQTRLYLNDGKGNFTRVNNFPKTGVNSSCIRIGDFNNDGKEDIFIGARNIPGEYGLIPSSILLQGNGDGTFSDVTRKIAPDLLSLGMVTDAQWTDVDGDGKQELAVVGDWMPLTILKFINGKFSVVKKIQNSSGWWNCLSAADINNDGKPDLIAGNFGLNSNIKADKDHPAKLYVEDFDNNGQTDCIPVYYKTDGKAYPYYLKGDIQAEIPSLKKNFLHYSDYAGKTIDEIFSKEQLSKAQILTVDQTQTCIFINKGNDDFEMQPMPIMAQLSPVFGILATDLNSDSIKDIFLAGNFYGVKPQTGRFDANYGCTFLQNAAHQFTYINPLQIGLFIKGEARDVAEIKIHGEDYILVAMNNAPLYLFKKKK